jgi:hypothetical protein
VSGLVRPREARGACEGGDTACGPVPCPRADGLCRRSCDHPADGRWGLAHTRGVPLLKPIRTWMHEAVMAAT